MYGRGSISPIIAGGVVAGSGAGALPIAGSGATVLPYTSNNHLALALAVTAIAIGLSLLVSQVAVRIIRKKYQK